MKITNLNDQNFEEEDNEEQANFTLKKSINENRNSESRSTVSYLQYENIHYRYFNHSNSNTPNSIESIKTQVHYTFPEQVHNLM